MKSPTEEIFDKRTSEFIQKYLPTHLEEVRYVKENWLDLYKEKLVKAWVDQHPHFNNVVTSRVEGIHGLLKSHLKRSTLDLFEAWKAIKQALSNQLAELRSNQAKQQSQAPIKLSGPLYATHLVRHSTAPLLLEPRQQIDPLAATLLLPRSSIRRALSRFEVVKVAIASKTPPICSKCHALGHARNSKLCPLRYAELRFQPTAGLEQLQKEQNSTAEASMLIEQEKSTISPEPTLQATISIEPFTQVFTDTISRLPTPSACSLSPILHQAQLLNYNDPREIYQRYVAAKDTWQWACHYGIIKPAISPRDWTREEMMAYLDWDKAENDRVNIQVALESGNGLSNAWRNEVPKGSSFRLLFCLEERSSKRFFLPPPLSHPQDARFT
ncbi:hypothetical protein NPX13_g3933 [Xylaria arbuscula]|uniref:Zinc knuckle domain-containing protein n=1 Tax=Xylaria arbuscula TaxID=114810 RepID=A0A9W8NGZ1_9PEZI|nr:hypothetical protein NPX13_g3933 [Xylaria arbuscula]